MASANSGSGAMSCVGFPALSELCANPDAYFERLDVGALNLICASGLPGAENIDVAKSVDWLDEAAQRVEFQTRRHWYRFIKSPENYHDSPGYFCCYFLLQVLQEDFGVKYNPARVKDPKFQDVRCIDPDFKDSRDLFIHGIIDGPGGTCGSMPIVYVAVGRRLGYPLKLVETKCHLFFRWEDLEGSRFGFPEQFNIEGAGEGIHTYPDGHYRKWPEPWGEADINGGYYLKSLTPSEELASFLVTRGECLSDHGRLEETIQCYRWASALAPNDPRYSALLQQYTNRQVQKQLRAIEYVDEQRRLRRVLETSGRPSGVRGHSPNCECTQCREIRASARMISTRGHDAACNCAQCRDARGPDESAVVPGHPTYCQCRACQKLRSHTQDPAMAGHSPNCHCYHCQEARASSRPPGTPGHPPGCSCSHCLQSRTQVSRG